MYGEANGRAYPWVIGCPNENRNNHDYVRQIFRSEGLEIAEFERACSFCTYVLTTCGELYSHDMSHGGGMCWTWHPSRERELVRHRLGSRAV